MEVLDGGWLVGADFVMAIGGLRGASWDDGVVIGVPGLETGGGGGGVGGCWGGEGGPWIGNWRAGGGVGGDAKGRLLGAEFDVDFWFWLGGWCRD